MISAVTKSYLINLNCRWITRWACLATIPLHAFQIRCRQTTRTDITVILHLAYAHMIFIIASSPVRTPNGVQVHGSDGVQRSDMQLKSNINRQHPKDGGTSSLPDVHWLPVPPDQSNRDLPGTPRCCRGDHGQEMRVTTTSNMLRRQPHV